MFRVYARTFDQRVLPDTKTVTPSPQIAEAAYRELMARRELWATKTAAVLSFNNRQIEYRRFDRVIPVDKTLAQKLKHGEPLPTWPRVLDHNELEIRERSGERVLFCYLDGRLADCLILDDSQPIRTQ